MTNNEEFERKMNFIVEQQAQFAADIQQLQESQARTEQVVAQTADAVSQTVGAVAQTTEAVAQTTEAVAQSAETVGQVVEVVTRLANVTHAGFNDVNAKINALVDAQIRTEANLARTDENLRSLISVVNRHLSEGRNGK